MTPTEKMGLIKRHTFTEWTSLVGCKVKPRQLSRHQYIVTHVSDVLSFRSRVKLITPQVTLRRWDNGPTLKRHPVGHLDRYCLYAGNGGKTISLTALLDNYNLFHLTGKPVQQTVIDWEPSDHTHDTRVQGRTYTYKLHDNRFVVEVADLQRIVNGMGIRMKAHTHGDVMLVDFLQVPKRHRNTLLSILRHKTELLTPWTSPSSTT